MSEVLPQLRPHNNSPMETRARLFFLRGGLPEPELNVVITDQASGQWLSDSDFVWRDQRSWPSSTATITAQIVSSGRTTWPGARTSRTTDGPSCN